MAFSGERFLLLPIGAGAVPWDSSTPTVSGGVLGGAAADVLTPRQSSGVFLNFSASRTITFDLGASPPLVNFAFLGGFQFTGVDPEDVTVQWDSDNDVAFGSATAWGSHAYPIRATGGAVARLDMTQPNLGLADAELGAVMNRGQLHSYFKSPSFPTGVQERYHRLTLSQTGSDASDRAYVPIIQAGWGWQPDGAQWAPEGLQRRLVKRSQPGDVLRGWQFTAQHVYDDVFHLKLMEWFQANGRANRAIFWQDPDIDARFVQNCAMVEVLGLTATQRAGSFASQTEETYGVSFNLIERFNDETET